MIWYNTLFYRICNNNMYNNVQYIMIDALNSFYIDQIYFKKRQDANHSQVTLADIAKSKCGEEKQMFLL